MNITDTNIFALDKVFSPDGDAVLSCVPNAVRGPSVQHIKRCLVAGLVTIEDGLVLTELGRSAIASRRARMGK